MYTLTSHTTQMGHRAHTVATQNRDFAVALYEQALNIDIEPDFAASDGTYVIEFIADDADCQAALADAMPPVPHRGTAHPTLTAHTFTA